MDLLKSRDSLLWFIIPVTGKGLYDVTFYF
jgi:hypothetical protein